MTVWRIFSFLILVTPLFCLILGLICWRYPPKGPTWAPGLSVPPGPGQSGGLAVCAECGGPDLVWPGTGADRGICLGLSGHANLECGGPVSGGAHLDSGGGCPGAPVYDSNGSSAWSAGLADGVRPAPVGTGAEHGEHILPVAGLQSMEKKPG